MNEIACPICGEPLHSGNCYVPGPHCVICGFEYEE
jgi:hypothetical protein